MKSVKRKIELSELKPGADLGGGGGLADALLLRDSTPCRPKGSPLWYFFRNPFWPTDPKIFRKAPLAPIYTKFEGGRAPKKTRFFFEIFHKVAKNGVLTVFLKILLRRRKFCQNRGKTVLWESSKNQFGRPKENMVVKILVNFLKIRPPPRENPRSAPG